jgi:hypothetical protein
MDLTSTRNDMTCTQTRSRPVRWSRMLAGMATAAGLVLLGGCASETLFRSSFNSQAPGQVPSTTQTVGTANVSADPGGVIIDGPVPGSSENWVRIGRTNAQHSAIAVFQGDFAKTYPAGTYNFLGALFIPSGTGLASVEFDTGPSGGPPSTSFLHLDFTTDNNVRINDDPDNTWGIFPRNQVFTLSVSLEVTSTSAIAHMALFGTGASGTRDFTIPAPFSNFARQFGAIKVWMGFPWSGSFDATDLIVTRRKNP